MTAAEYEAKRQRMLAALQEAESLYYELIEHEGYEDEAHSHFEAAREAMGTL